LQGLKVAIPTLKGIGQAALQAWLAKDNVDSAGVGFVEVPYSVMGAYLKAGRIDAALITEPELSVVRGTVRASAAPFDVIAPRISPSTRRFRKR
jgi:ABC-type nitrate/sulfonate/bicarbonate transport system substrate-binding protein